MTTYGVATVVAAVIDRWRETGVPSELLYGSTRYKPGLVTANMVSISERPNGDTYGPPSTAGGNPRPVATRNCGCTAAIQGRSTATGAGEEQHRAVVTALLHALVADLLRCGGDNGHPVTIGAGGFVVDPKQASEYGARYVLQFSVAEDVPSSTTWNTVSSLTYTGSGMLVIGGSETEGCAQEPPAE